MPNPLLHIRVPPEGLALLREARIKAMREGKTLGMWLTELLRDMFSGNGRDSGEGSAPSNRRR